jgi:hypothetical protein
MSNRRKPQGTDTCPMCCHAENLPPTRDLRLRNLVAVERAWELSAGSTGEGEGRGDYLVLVDGHAVASVGSPLQVEVVQRPWADGGHLRGLPMTDLGARLCVLSVRVAGLLHWALTGEEVAVHEEVSAGG